MARPDPAALIAARYPFHCQVEPRFSDVDVNRHLNNVALAGMLEEARVRFHRGAGYYSAAIAAGLSTMVVHFTTDYLDQAFYPQPLDVYVATVEIGRTSYVVQQLSLQEGRAVNLARAVMVCIANDRPTPLPPAFREGIDEWMLRLEP